MYDELIKNLRICSRCDFVQDCNGCTQKSDDAFCCDKLLHQAADAIEELEKEVQNWKITAGEEAGGLEHWFENYQKDVPRWIPVTERLPKEEETVLAFGTLGVAWLDWRHDNKWCCYGGVTHWMTLPEPPKEE